MPRSRPFIEDASAPLRSSLRAGESEEDALVPFKCFVHAVFETFPLPDDFTTVESTAAGMLVTLACIGKSEAMRQRLLNDLLTLHHCSRKMRQGGAA
jgi:hypothetical protein